MKVNSKSIVILNVVKDLKLSPNKILHYIQDGTDAGIDFLSKLEAF